MRFFVNRDTNALIQNFDFLEQIQGPAGPNSAAVKRGDTPPLDWLFGHAYGAAEEIDAAADITTFKFGAKLQGHLGGDYVISNWDQTALAYLYRKIGGSRFTDAVTTNTSPTLTSATAGFMASDAGLVIAGAGITPGTTILSVQSATSITLSANATASATGVTITLPIATRVGGVSTPGRTPFYRVTPSFNTVNPTAPGGLNDLFITAGVSRVVANATARFALTGLALDTVVRQADEQSYWIVTDVAHLGDTAGWSDDVPEAEYIDLQAEVEVKQGDQVASTLTFTLRVINDVNKGDEGLRSVANPVYPSPGDLLLTTSLNAIVKSVDFTAEAGKVYLVDTSGGAVTATLPATPVIGNSITFLDAKGSFGTHALTLSRNGNKIDNATADLVTAAQLLVATYHSSGYGWRCNTFGSLFKTLDVNSQEVLLGSDSNLYQIPLLVQSKEVTSAEIAILVGYDGFGLAIYGTGSAGTDGPLIQGTQYGVTNAVNTYWHTYGGSMIIGATSADGTGAVLQSITASFSSGFSVWGAALPGSQPSTPSTLPDVIAILQSYGLCT